MENKPENEGREGLKKDLQHYIDVKIDLVKLKAIEKAGSAAGGAATGMSAAILGYFFLLFVSVTAAFALNDLFNSLTAGFGCIALFYGLAGAAVIFFREKLFTFPIINALLKKFYYPKQSQF